MYNDKGFVIKIIRNVVFEPPLPNKLKEYYDGKAHWSNSRFFLSQKDKEYAFAKCKFTSWSELTHEQATYLFNFYMYKEYGIFGEKYYNMVVNDMEHNNFHNGSELFHIACSEAPRVLSLKEEEHRVFRDRENYDILHIDGIVDYNRKTKQFSPTNDSQYKTLPSYVNDFKDIINAGYGQLNILTKPYEYEERIDNLGREDYEKEISKLLKEFADKPMFYKDNGIVASHLNCGKLMEIVENLYKDSSYKKIPDSFYDTPALKRIKNDSWYGVINLKEFSSLIKDLNAKVYSIETTYRKEQLEKSKIKSDKEIER